MNSFKIGQLAFGVSLAPRGNRILQLTAQLFVVDLSSKRAAVTCKHSCHVSQAKQDGCLYLSAQGCALASPARAQECVAVQGGE